MAELFDDNEQIKKDLYRKMLAEDATAESTRKYSFPKFKERLSGDKVLLGKIADLSVKKGWSSNKDDFYGTYFPELTAQAPPTPKPKPVPAPVQQFPVGIAAPESIKGAAPSVTDIGREMAFEPAVQQPIEPVEPVEPIGVMAPEAAQKPMPSVTEVGREMAFKPPVEPKMPKEEKMSPLETAGQKVMEFASGFNRALFKAPSSVVKTASELGVGVLNMLGGDMQSEDAVLYSLADKYDKWLDTSEVARKWIGKPEYTGLATDVGSGLGQIASMVAAGPQGASQALLKTPTVLKAVSQQMFSKPSLIAFSQVFNSEFENMKAKGESEQTAFNQGLTNALATSPLENLPLINLAERLNKTIGVKLARRVLNALQQGAEEGGQEAVQQVFSNLTNNQLVESEENIVDWAKGIQPSAEAGGVVGLLIGGLANAKAAKRYSKTPGLDKFSDNVVNNEIIQEAARGYGDNITKAEQQGRKPDSFNQKQLKKISENPEAWVRDEIKYIQQTIESNKTLGLDSKVEENSLAKATSLLNQIKAEKKGMEQAALAPVQEAVPVAPEAEVVPPVEPIAPEVTTEAAPVTEEVPFEEVPAETEDELAFLDEMRLNPEEEAALLAQEGIIPAAPVAPAEEAAPEVVPEVVATQTRDEIIRNNEKARQEYKKQRAEKREERLARKQQLIDIGLSEGEATEVLTKEIRDEEDAFESSLPKVSELPKSQFQVDTEKNEANFKKMLQQTGAKETNKAWGITQLGDSFGYEIGDKNGAIYIKPYEEEIDTEEGRENVVTGTAIELVYVPPGQRGVGKARKLIQQVVDAADKTGTTLKIEAVPQGEEVNIAGLKKLYESFGFVFDDIYGTRTPAAVPVSQAEEVAPEITPAPKGRKKAAPVTPAPAAPETKEEAPLESKTSSDYGNYLLDLIEQKQKDLGWKDYAELRKGLVKSFEQTKEDRGEPRAISNLESIYVGYLPEGTQAGAYQAIKKNFEKQQQAVKPEAKPEPIAKKIDKKSVQASLDKAKEEYEKAKGAFDKKRYELDKTTREDVKNLFGERKVEMKAKGLFEMPRISPEQRERAIQPFRDRMNKAKEEVNRLTKMLEEGEEVTKELTFEKEYEQVQRTGKEARKGKGAQKTERAVRPKAKPVRNAGKSSDAITARSITFYSDPIGTSLQYLMDATYHPDLLESIFGGPSRTTKSGRKDISGERKARIQFLDKNSPIKTADRLAEILAERYAEENNIDVKDAEQQHDFASIATDIISSYSSRNQMVRELLRLNEQQNEEFEFMYNPEAIYGEGYNEDIAKEIDGIMDELPDSYWEGREITDEEFNNLFAEEVEPETKGREEAAPEFTSEQSSEAATAFDKAKTSKGFDKKHGKGAYKALSDITKNFEDIMDKVSDKIKQDCL